MKRPPASRTGHVVAAAALLMVTAAPHEYRERGQKRGTTIRFEYRVPNG